MKATIKIIRYKTSFNKIYYNLILDNKIIGNAWITKRYRYLFNGLYIRLDSNVRHKGYGRKYYDLLLTELSKNDIESVVIWVNNSNSSIYFFNKVVDKYSSRLHFLNYTRFIENLIIE